MANSIHFPYSCASLSPEETEAFGRDVAEALLLDETLPPFIALYGDLGVGKTAFVRGLSSRLSPESAVRSPTFSLVNEYPVRNPVSRRRFSSLFHFDMYRISSEDDLDSIGFWDYPLRRGLILTEWSENVPFALPEDYLRVTITKCSDNESKRIIKAERVLS